MIRFGGSMCKGLAFEAKNIAHVHIFEISMELITDFPAEVLQIIVDI